MEGYQVTTLEDVVRTRHLHYRDGNLDVITAEQMGR